MGLSLIDNVSENRLLLTDDISGSTKSTASGDEHEHDQNNNNNETSESNKQLKCAMDINIPNTNIPNIPTSSFCVNQVQLSSLAINMFFVVCTT